MNFDTWFTQLVEDYKWAEPAQMHHRPETFKSIAHKVYMECVATGFKPITECRRHVYNIVCKTPGDNKKVNWREAEKKQPEEIEEWKPASPEHVDKCVKEFNEMLSKAPMLQRHSGYKQLIEERGWDKKKPAPYPPTSMEEAYAKARHIAYIKANYEPRTGKPLPTWKPEHEWNTDEQ